MKTSGIFYKSGVFIGLLLSGIFITASAQPGHFGRFGYGHRGGFGGFYRSAPSPYYNRGFGIGVGVHVGGYYANQPGFRGYGGRYSPFYGPHYYSSIPRGSLSLSFGGNPYFYYGGAFYRPFGGYYRSVFPPVGLRIGILPPGYSSFYIGPDPYYYYNGSYYRPYSDGGYEVTDAPLGAVLHHLPQAAKRVTVNGEPFYELNGTYYKEGTDADGNITYTVTGKNGNISNTPNGNDNNNDNNNNNAYSPRIGDTVSELPADTRVITLNGEKLYVTSDDTYYRKEADGAYRVVGIAGQIDTSGDSSQQQ